MIAPYTSESEFIIVLGQNERGNIPWIDHDGFWTFLFSSHGQESIPVRVPLGEFGDYDLNSKFVKCVPKQSAILMVDYPRGAGMTPRRFRFADQ